MPFKMSQTFHVDDSGGQGRISVNRTSTGGTPTVLITVRDGMPDPLPFTITMEEAGGLAEVLKKISDEYKAEKQQTTALRSAQFGDH